MPLFLSPTTHNSMPVPIKSVYLYHISFYSIIVGIVERYFVASVQTIRWLFLPLPKLYECVTCVVVIWNNDTPIETTREGVVDAGRGREEVEDRVEKWRTTVVPGRFMLLHNIQRCKTMTPSHINL